MPTLSESRLLRYITFGALYLAQGVPWGFIAVGYVVFLTDLGLDNTAIGSAVGLAYLPWSFKIVWGPIIDRFPSARFGRRRPYIIAAELLMGATLLLLLLVDPKRDLALVGAVIFIHNTFAALQDVAVDAMAVDILPSRESGSVNSVMWACKSLGVAVGGGAGTIFAKHFGWSALFVSITLIIWAIMGLALAVRERPAGAGLTDGEGDNSESAALTTLELFKRLWRSFAFPTAIVGLLIALLTPAGYALTMTVGTRMLRAELKLSEEMIGLLSGVIHPLSGVVGALIGGICADAFGVRKVIGCVMAGIAATLGLFALLPHLWPSMTFLIGWTIASQLLITGYSAATLGFFMRMSDPLVGATQFTIFMAMTNLTYSFSAPGGGVIADRFGLPATYGIAAVVQLVAISLLFFADPRVAEARFRAHKGRAVPLPEVARAPGA